MKCEATVDLLVRKATGEATLAKISITESLIIVPWFDPIGEQKMNIDHCRTPTATALFTSSERVACESALEFDCIASTDRTKRFRCCSQSVMLSFAYAFLILDN